MHVAGKADAAHRCELFRVRLAELVDGGQRRLPPVGGILFGPAGKWPGRFEGRRGSVPKGLAGVVDGASRFRVWRSLVLPQVGPGIMALALFSFLSGWGEYILPQVLAPGNQVQVLSVYLAGFLSDDNNYNFNMFKAVGVFYVIPVMIVYALFHKYLMNIYGGGSKG